MSMYIDNRNGGPNSNRATDSQIRRLLELKIEFNPYLTWLEAKALLKNYHATKNKEKSNVKK